jgi:hypothetical protein
LKPRQEPAIRINEIRHDDREKPAGLVKDSVNTVWWFSKTEHPKADVPARRQAGGRRVLAPWDTLPRRDESRQAQWRLSRGQLP